MSLAHFQKICFDGEYLLNKNFGGGGGGVFESSYNILNS